MKKLLALALIGSTVIAAAPAFAVDNSISKLCGPDGPESYKRPGGYCEQIASNVSAVPTGSGQPWWWDLPS